MTGIGKYIRYSRQKLYILTNSQHTNKYSIELCVEYSRVKPGNDRPTTDDSYHPGIISQNKNKRENRENKSSLDKITDAGMNSIYIPGTQDMNQRRAKHIKIRRPAVDPSR